MDEGTPSRNDGSRPFPLVGIGVRLTAWIVVVFVITLIVFVGLDVYHEARFANSLGAEAGDLTSLIVNTLVLHTVHAGVTVLAFGLAIHILIRKLISKRIANIVLTIQHFRRGTWRVRIPRRTRDEIDWLTEAFRQLGPDLEQKLTTFVEVDRKSVVALLGSRYHRSIAPTTLEIIAAARERSDSDPAWREIAEHASVILAELERLGQPDHPAIGDIVGLKRSWILPSEEDSRADPRRSCAP